MKIKYFMSHGSPWTFLGHKKVNEISKKNNCELDIMPVNYGEIFPVSGGLPVHKRPLQRQKYRLQELKRWSEFLKIKLNPEPKHFPSRSLLPSKVIISVKILNFENVNDMHRSNRRTKNIQDLLGHRGALRTLSVRRQHNEK